MNCKCLNLQTEGVPQGCILRLIYFEVNTTYLYEKLVFFSVFMMKLILIITTINFRIKVSEIRFDFF